MNEKPPGVVSGSVQFRCCSGFMVKRMKTLRRSASLASLVLFGVTTLAADTNKPAPCTAPEHRQLDFWVGDWDVRPTGTPPVGPAARNTVTLDDNTCVITEHWTAPSGSEGQSFNIFDRSYGVWRQTWVDNVGSQHDYRGSLQGGNMVLIGDVPTPGVNGLVHTRLTLFHIGPDSVRQFSEFTTDSGKTWQVGYDLMYVRRKP